MFKLTRKASFKIIAPALLWALAVPLVVFAQQVQSGLSAVRSPFGLTGRFSSANDVPSLIEAIIYILLYIAAGLAVLFIIIGGYQYLTSAGNEEAAEKGKKTVINAVIGVVFIILAWVVVNVIVGTITRF